VKYLVLVIAICCFNAKAQFAPAAGKLGSTALRHDSSCFVNWALQCSIQRGFMDISNPDSGFASVGDSTSALGNAMQNGIVSLGDAGMAVLTFQYPIKNGPGWDFAVFENSFLDSFLELAFVEVSSDGIPAFKLPDLDIPNLHESIIWQASTELDLVLLST
jgi:hypothetical protein